MQVYKFGGASVKDAAGVKNLARIVSLNVESQILIVVSAMGKTTNALEQLTAAYVSRLPETQALFENLLNYHTDILHNLFPSADHPVFNEVANTLVEIEWILEEEPHPDYGFNYDQIVSIGELLSSRIVSAYLNSQGLQNTWLDARGYIHTDNTYREASVDWQKTCQSIESGIPNILERQFIVTQGFIGGTSENFTTTLGREGSDYTAAIFASCLKAESVTIWKDVPGVLNADPKLFPAAVKYDELLYSEALEMTFYGATIIHPKTLKPLTNLNIPLYVKPFLHPEESGTVISGTAKMSGHRAAIIVKQNQVLTSFFTKDSSFVSEDHLSEIFKVFSRFNIKINMMQNSALSFSACFDWDKLKFESLIGNLGEAFQIKYNRDLELITIRHYDDKTLEELSAGKSVLLEQLSRNTAQIVIKST